MGAYAVVKEAIRRRGPRRQALLYIPAALRARRVWRAAPGAAKPVWRWTGAAEKSGGIFRPTPVARSARERGGLLVVWGQGVMTRKGGKRDCQAEMSVVVHWCCNVLIGHGWRIASRVCAAGYAAGRPVRARFWPILSTSLFRSPCLAGLHEYSGTANMLRKLIRYHWMDELS